MPRKPSYEEAVGYVKQIGLKPLFKEYLGSTKSHLVECSCGESFEVIFSTIMRRLKKDPNCVMKCLNCVNNSFKTTKYTYGYLTKLFFDRGIIPLFTEEEMLQLQETLPCKKFRRKGFSFRCSCGKTGLMSINNLVDNFMDVTKITCFSCRQKNSVRNVKLAENLKKDLQTLQERFEIKILNLSEIKGNRSKVSFHCPKCNNIYTVTWAALRQWERTPSCDACQNINKPRGKEHASYNALITDEERRMSKYGRNNLANIWASILRKTYRFCCNIQKTQNRNLNAHHVKPWSYYPFERFSFSNGIVLSEPIHKEFHSLHGQHSDNHKEFYGFYKEKTGCEYKESNIRNQIISSLDIPIFPEKVIHLSKIKAELEEQGVIFHPVYFQELLRSENYFVSKFRRDYKVDKENLAEILVFRECNFPLKVEKFLTENSQFGNLPADRYLTWVNILGDVVLTLSVNEKDAGVYSIVDICQHRDFYKRDTEVMMLNTFFEKYQPAKVYYKIDGRWMRPDLEKSLHLLGFNLHQKLPPQRVPEEKYKIVLPNEEIPSGQIFDCGQYIFLREKG